MNNVLLGGCMAEQSRGAETEADFYRILNYGLEKDTSDHKINESHSSTKKEP